MKKIFLLILFFTVFMVNSQNDCVDAIIVCGNSGFEDLTATGVGTQELNGSNTCSSQENNSLWLNVSVDTGGTLGFTLTPTFADGTTNTDINIDFDFFIFGPNVICGNIGQAIRCSTTNPAAAGSANNLTGINSTETDTAEGPGNLGNNFVSWLNVNAGDSYFVVIDRPIGSSNFRIDWNGTATFNSPPTITPPIVGTTYNLEECDGIVLDNVATFNLDVNSTPIISGQPDTQVTYYTTNNDAQAAINVITTPTSFLNTSDPQTIYARVSNIITGCFVITDFEIDVLDGLTFTAPNNMLVCDDNNDGLWNFDLTQNDATIINGLPDLQVSYYESVLNANTDTTPIIGLHENVGNPQVIWVRLENTVTSCFGVESFEIEVFNTPTLTTPPTQILCDDDNNGTMPFDLLALNTTINSDAGMTISYHTTQADADANLNAITTNPHESGNATIYVRVENIGNTNCYDTTNFDLEVYESPFPLLTGNVLPLEECDNTTVGTLDDGFIIVDITQRDTDILNGQSATDFTLTYFTDAGYTTQITTPISFQNTVVDGQTIYVRISNNLNTDCFADTSFELNIYEQPTLTTPPTQILCDDDNNGTMPFDLLGLNTSVNSDAGMTISYHTSQADADANLNAITTNPHESGNATIYVRVENSSNTNCYDTTNFDLEVYESAFPILFPNVPNLIVCDDTSVGTDTDGFVVFDLTNREIDILNGQAATDFALTYFSDAGYVNQILTPASYTNTTINGQTIYVRMSNNLNTSCFTDTSFEIVVATLPVLNVIAGTPPYVLEQCDDNFDGFNAFNLTEVNTDIITIITDEVFTYYESQAEAIAGVLGTEIANPIAYTNTIVNTDDTIWARAENTNGCFRTAQIELVVKPSAIPTGFLRVFSECDDGTDQRDGISTFNFSSVTAEIQALFPTAIDVFYYQNEADATSEINAIVDPSNYQNTSSLNMQEIWVRADSQLGNDCLGNGHHVTLIVEALPTANAPTSPLTECDDDAIPADGFFGFNTTAIEAEILDTQSLADVTITYFNQDGTLIGTSLPNPFITNTQTVTIVVTNNTTNDPQGACTDQTTLDFVVQELPLNNDIFFAELCDENPDDALSTATFNTTNLETDIGAQAGMLITYLDAIGNPLTDMDGNFIVSPFPSSFTTEDQTIQVVVTNPAFAVCSIAKPIHFMVNALPEYDLPTNDLVCENILPHAITVTNPDGVYDYEWFDSNAVSIGTNQTLLITDTSALTKEGVDFVVVVTNPTTGCSRTKLITVRKSSIATLTAADIVTIEFNSPLNRIDILLDNLGSGDYEFALDHATDSRPYQDSPTFIQLIGGSNYTIRVNDKNGCGEVSFTLSLIDYPLFVTPNGDGINDYWQLEGVDNSISIISPIYILDRYGKVLKELDANSLVGWDGLYLGKPVAETDYWFMVNLIDTQGKVLEFKGHFALRRRR